MQGWSQDDRSAASGHARHRDRGLDQHQRPRNGLERLGMAAGHLAIERQAIVDTVAEAVAEMGHNVTAKSVSLNSSLPRYRRLGVLRPRRRPTRARHLQRRRRVRTTRIVAVNGSSFVATEDNPGQCPGTGWQLPASAGSRGGRGPVGPRGEHGAEAAAPGIKMLHLDPKDYVLSLIMESGKHIRYHCEKYLCNFSATCRGNGKPYSLMRASKGRRSIVGPSLPSANNGTAS